MVQEGGAVGDRAGGRAASFPIVQLLSSVFRFVFPFAAFRGMIGPAVALCCMRGYLDNNNVGPDLM